MTELPPLVVDANVVISAALKDGVTRRLLLDPRLCLYSPQYLWEELSSVAEEVSARGSIPGDRLERLWEMFRARILIVPGPLVERNLPTALKQLEGGDLDDAPYLAAAMAVQGAIWTHDKNFRRRAGSPTISTEELLAALG